MVPLAVIVRHKLVDDVAHTSLAEENYPIETLFADRAHPMIEVLQYAVDSAIAPRRD